KDTSRRNTSAKSSRIFCFNARILDAPGGSLNSYKKPRKTNFGAFQPNPARERLPRALVLTSAQNPEKRRLLAHRVR
ncbi:MAG TPA: hypothetical protein VHX49_07150, partial [Candidatus Acidoferrales bacterium]|nr:hypothetical protein [Candidatus Acidoferrales bacterium]